MNFISTTPSKQLGQAQKRQKNFKMTVIDLKHKRFQSNNLQKFILSSIHMFGDILRKCDGN